ncbi:Primosomal replication protein N [Vibrio stylophorae]|uniref:Replication restart protein PriB n=1 Tax=Vibrio stylophorae TaxID=659351 RepID=A0ABN8DV01_9VIBR|nr:primosomal replication protein N [Vibrio stylophorae]CAH0534602.1 Primosomal replication protein N [Vibrio stylophorae]
MTNRMVLDGTLVKGPIRHQSPAGIQHCKFWLEHRSNQQEAGLSRQAYCRMPVVYSGAASHAFTENLVIGKSIRVVGFVSQHKTNQGLPMLVLHAEHIESL